MDVPHYLCSNVILTFAYLINHLSSSPLGDEVPLNRLHIDHDLFPLPPHVFGCVDFVQDQSASKSKLAPWALKGVFVGYSRAQKGYHVYFPEHQIYVISTGITFHESLRYFIMPMPTPSLALIPLPVDCSLGMFTSHLAWFSSSGSHGHIL